MSLPLVLQFPCCTLKWVKPFTDSAMTFVSWLTSPTVSFYDTCRYPNAGKKPAKRLNKICSITSYWGEF